MKEWLKREWFKIGWLLIGVAFVIVCFMASQNGRYQYRYERPSDIVLDTKKGIVYEVRLDEANLMRIVNFPHGRVKTMDISRVNK